MISWTDVNSLQKQKLELEVNLNEVLQKTNRSNDEVNELKSEILYLEKQIEKIVGTKELKRQKELKRKKLGIDETNKKTYYAFKEKYKRISKMKIATARMINLLDKYNKQKFIEEELVKVKK